MNDIINIKVEKLKPHPVNEKIYISDAEREKEILTSIKENGILEPLTVQKEGEGYIILSGVRRFRCAVLLGLKTVPCIVTETSNPVITIIEHNRYRQKTPIEIYNEAKALEDALKPIAEQHSLAQLNQNRVVKFDDSEKLGDVRSIIADKLNVSTGYLTMLKQVVENKDKIPDVVEKLEKGRETVYSAYARLKNINTPKESVEITLGHYVAGKTRLAKQIIARIPEHICYVEPFGGFCSVLLNKPKSKVEVYNDINKDVVNLILSLKEFPLILLSELQLMPYSRWLFEQLVPKLNDPFEIPDPRRAAIFYYVNATSFSGLSSDNPSFSFSVINSHAERLRNSISSLILASNRLLDVQLENKPYQYILDHYDSEQTFFYLDPPYYRTHDALGIHFTDEQHKELHDRVMKLKGRWLITLNDAPRVRKLYSDCNIEEVVVMESAPNSREAERKYYTHLFISPKNA